MKDDYDDDDMEFIFDDDDDEYDDVVYDADAKIVELQMVWVCPKCKEGNLLQKYRLGKYECAECGNIVEVTVTLSETKQ
jgi:DNA-directed RNA polymerase subunit RPC12/RpoP